MTLLSVVPYLLRRQARSMSHPPRRMKANPASPMKSVKANPTRKRANATSLALPLPEGREPDGADDEDDATQELGVGRDGDGVLPSLGDLVS